MKVPLDVPKKSQAFYKKNYQTVTQKTENLMLYAGDQKVEHLNDDFHGKGISPEDADPEHLFRIAAQARIGCFATQLGLIARYGMDYPKVPYLVKINSKTNLVPTKQREPFSGQWIHPGQVEEFRKNSGLNIVGIGYTVYLGSEFEPHILTEAAQAIYEAHQYGLLAVLWMYPRGEAVTYEKDPHLIAGAAGVAACLGADFVKVNFPKPKGKATKDFLNEAVKAAGRTKLVCAGGSKTTVNQFLKDLYEHIHIHKAAGSATGRNIHQRTLKDAVKFCNAISAITYDNKTVKEAMKIYKG